MCIEQCHCLMYHDMKIDQYIVASLLRTLFINIVIHRLYICVYTYLHTYVYII